MTSQSDTRHQQTLIDTGHRVYTPNYKPRDVVFSHGRGSVLWDVSGREYLDLGSGIGVNCLGHANPKLIATMEAQAKRLWHTSNVYFSEPPVALAEDLVNHTFAQRVFFCNSGAEANEAAIKVARKYAYDNFPPSKRNIITFNGSFHGRTLAAVTATAQPKYHEGFAPLPGGFKYCSFNDIDAFRQMMDETVCAVLLEPIQGEGGVRLFSVEFLEQVRQLCDEYDALLIFDEVQCGMGRTGQLFAYQWAAGVVPDIVTVAKAIGGGLPIAATLLGGKLAETLSLGSHGSTFGGNPICCEVARVILKTVISSAFLDNISRKGELLRSELEQIRQQTGLISEIRGKGLMIGVQLAETCGPVAGDIMHSCLQNGLLVLQSGSDVIRLLPAFTIENDQITQAMKIFARVLSDYN